jgi:hypothetical protein
VAICALALALPASARADVTLTVEPSQNLPLPRATVRVSVTSTAASGPSAPLPGAIQQCAIHTGGEVCRAATVVRILSSPGLPYVADIGVEYLMLGTIGQGNANELCRTRPARGDACVLRIAQPDGQIVAQTPISFDESAASGAVNPGGIIGRQGSALRYDGGEIRVVYQAADDTYRFRAWPEVAPSLAAAAGSGCFAEVGSFPTIATPLNTVVCDGAGIEHIDITLGPGGDRVELGGLAADRRMPASVTVDGGPGDDTLFDYANGPGQVTLIGGAGNDGLLDWSSPVAVIMIGGAGDDSFGWEHTDRGVATSADGGPGNDRFSAHSALGPDSISAGDGDDVIDINDGHGDPDTVSCGSGADELRADGRHDHVAADCELAVTPTRMDKTISADANAARQVLGGLHLARLARTGRFALPMHALQAGTLRATLTTPRKGRWTTIGAGSRRVARAGRYALTMRLNARGRALARRPHHLRVRIRLSFTTNLGGEPRTFKRLTGATLKR